VLSCPVYRRPDGWADRAENWHTHSLELCDEDMGVGDHECAFMRAQCAQMRAHHHISSIDVQTTGPIEPQIGTNTHWDNGTMGRTYGSRRSRVRIDARAARTNMRAALHIQHRRPSTGMEQGAATAASAKFECGARCKQK
jgi:hypothetical protein